MKSRDELKLSVDRELLESYHGAVPKHVGVIMDGNGRWANERGMVRIRGHHAGAKAVRAVVESCRYLGVEALTLYAFSAQNWGRPEDEVTGLMSLFDLYIKKERRTILDNGVQLRVIGDRSKLSPNLVKAIEDLEDVSRDSSDMVLQVAVSYGGREEIIQAVKRIAQEVSADELTLDGITEQLISNYMYSPDVPDPDLVIRTSGEFRVSNFLLWEIAYAEFFVTDVLWPDFNEHKLLEAFNAFSDRERRFGKTGAQIREEK